MNGIPGAETKGPSHKTRNLLWLRQRVWKREIDERDLGKQAEYLQKLIETISCGTKHLLSKADDTANTRSSRYEAGLPLAQA